LDKEFYPDDKGYDKSRFAKLYAISKQMPYLDCTKSKAALSNFDIKTINDFFEKYNFEFEKYTNEEINTLISALNQTRKEQDTQPENFLSILIGRRGRQDFYFELGEKTGVYHGLIAGATGTGKTTLLNNIITSIAEKYSPDELRLYLLDYKEGVEFQIFENHPNAELVLLDNSNFSVGVETIEKFAKEIEKRSKLFLDGSIKARNINEYNKKAQDKDKLPRMLMIIDEVQQLFNNYDRSSKINPLVLDIVKRGRSFGIHLLFSSQSYVNTRIAEDAISQIQLRISYKLAKRNECMAILRSDNDAPLTLEKYQLVYTVDNQTINIISALNWL